jgi:hypothetical protein
LKVELWQFQPPFDAPEDLVCNLVVHDVEQAAHLVLKIASISRCIIVQCNVEHLPIAEHKPLSVLVVPPISRSGSVVARPPSRVGRWVNNERRRGIFATGDCVERASGRTKRSGDGRHPAAVGIEQRIQREQRVSVSLQLAGAAVEDVIGLGLVGRRHRAALQ